MAIDLWLFALDLPPAELAALADLLDTDERARADRFRHARDRDHFIARHGLLRRLLGEVLDAAPATLGFDHNAYGKPSLGGTLGGMLGGRLRFNMADSDSLALCAVADDIELGCDIERRNPALADPEVARRLFATAEWRVFEALPPDQRTQGFFNCWTRKEAFIKAIGFGVSHPLDSFAVSLAPGEEARLIAGCEGWSLLSFEPVPGYQAALVGEGDAARHAGPPRWFNAGSARAAPRAS